MKLLPWHYGVRNLTRSPSRLMQSVAGSALVVLLVLAAAGFVRGMQESLTPPSGSSNVLILGAGSEESLERSEIKSAAAGIVAASVEGIKERLGVAYVSPEVHMATLLKLTAGSSEDHLAMLRGVTAAAFLVHPEVRIVSGRAPGVGEVLVGRLAATKLGVSAEDLAVGRSIWIDDRSWIVSGQFEAPGTVMEAEIWIDLYELQITARRDSLSCVILTLDDGAELVDVDVLCKRRLDLELVAMYESDYYSGLLAFYRPVQAMVWLTAILIALGGFFGGLNTLYAAFSARIRELATLQTLGFRRLALLAALIQESILATVAGSLLAAAIGLLVLDGLAVRFSMGAFALVVDAPVIVTGLTAGLLLGLVGSLPPAWRCLTPPISAALKSF